MKMRGGEIIQQLRKNIGVSQKELAKKLFMTQQKLSKVESGEQELNMMEFLVAFQVLGVAMSDFWVMHLNYEEFEGYFLYSRIRALLAYGTEDEVREIFMEFRKNHLAKHSFMSQFTYFIEIKVSEENEEKRIEMLYDALRFSRPEFRDDKIDELNLTYCEALIINEMAILYTTQGQIHKAISLLNGIYEKRENLRITPTERYMLFPRPLAMLYQLLMEVEEYEKAVKVCECMLEYCKLCSNFIYAPRGTYDLARCYEKMEKPSQDYLPLIKIAYYIARAIEQHELAEIINKEYKIV